MSTKTLKRGPVGLYPLETKCPVPILEKGSEKVARLCATPTKEFTCPACWTRVSPATRRAFNAERLRLRKAGSLKITDAMKRLIAQVIVEAAVRP